MRHALTVEQQRAFIRYIDESLHFITGHHFLSFYLEQVVELEKRSVSDGMTLILKKDDQYQS